MDELQLDTVPLFMIVWLAILLVVIWSIETLQQPNPVPYGPVRRYVGGATWTQVEPPITPLITPVPVLHLPNQYCGK